MPIAIPLENVNVSTPSFLHPNSWFTDPAPIALNDVLQYSVSLCLIFLHVLNILSRNWNRTTTMTVLLNDVNKICYELKSSWRTLDVQCSTFNVQPLEGILTARWPISTSRPSLRRCDLQLVTPLNGPSPWRCSLLLGPLNSSPFHGQTATLSSSSASKMPKLIHSYFMTPPSVSTFPPFKLMIFSPSQPVQKSPGLLSTPLLSQKSILQAVRPQ